MTLKEHFDSALSGRHLKLTIGFNQVWHKFIFFYMLNMYLLLSLGDSFWWKLFKDPEVLSNK